MYFHMQPNLLRNVDDIEEFVKCFSFSNNSFLHIIARFSKYFVMYSTLYINTNFTNEDIIFKKLKLLGSLHYLQSAKNERYVLIIIIFFGCSLQ